MLDNETYQVCMFCDNKQQALLLLEKIKEIDSSQWVYDYWIGSSGKDDQEFHEVRAWINGRVCAESVQQTITELMKTIKPEK